MINKIVMVLSKYPSLKKRVEAVAAERKCSFRDAVIFLLQEV